MISENLQPSDHCKKAARTAGAVLTQILRAFHYRDRHTYVRLYLQYVRPHLEFASPAWSPWKREDINCLEKVQEKAVKQVTGLTGRTYLERLAELGLTTLEERRAETDMVQTFKILKGIDDVDEKQWFERQDHTRVTRARQGTDVLKLQRADHEYRRQSFSQRAARGWNSLPESARACRNVGAFKAALRALRATAAPTPEIGH